MKEFSSLVPQNQPPNPRPLLMKNLVILTKQKVFENFLDD